MFAGHDGGIDRRGERDPGGIQYPPRHAGGYHLSGTGLDPVVPGHQFEQGAPESGIKRGIVYQVFPVFFLPSFFHEGYCCLRLFAEYPFGALA